MIKQDKCPVVKKSRGQQVEKPRVEYFKLSPSEPRYHKVMALANEIGCRWQDIIRVSVDSYLAKNGPKNGRKSNL